MNWLFVGREAVIPPQDRDVVEHVNPLSKLDW